MKLDNFIFLVPARKGSKGIKKKNLTKLNGKQLIKRTFETIKKIKKTNKFVLTNDEEIKKVARNYNVDDTYIRKQILSGDKSQLIETIKDFFISMRLNKDFNFVVILQPTSPLRNFNDIKKAIIRFKQKKYSSLYSISPSLEHPNETIYFKNKEIKYFINQKKTLRQNYKESFYINGAIYITEKQNILKGKIINEKNHGFHLMKKINSIDLDDNEDLELAKKLLKR